MVEPSQPLKEWNDLPDDLQLQVLACLDPRSLGRMACVSRRSERLIRSHVLWYRHVIDIGKRIPGYQPMPIEDYYRCYPESSLKEVLRDLTSSVQLYTLPSGYAPQWKELLSWPWPYSSLAWCVNDPEIVIWFKGGSDSIELRLLDLTGRQSFTATTVRVPGNVFNELVGHRTADRQVVVYSLWKGSGQEGSVLRGTRFEGDVVSSWNVDTPHLTDVSHMQGLVYHGALSLLLKSYEGWVIVPMASPLERITERMEELPDYLDWVRLYDRPLHLSPADAVRFGQEVFDTAAGTIYSGIEASLVEQGLPHVCVWSENGVYLTDLSSGNRTCLPQGQTELPGMVWADGDLVVVDYVGQKLRASWYDGNLTSITDKEYSSLPDAKALHAFLVETDVYALIESGGRSSLYDQARGGYTDQLEWTGSEKDRPVPMVTLFNLTKETMVWQLPFEPAIAKLYLIPTQPAPTIIVQGPHQFWRCVVHPLMVNSGST